MRRFAYIFIIGLFIALAAAAVPKKAFTGNIGSGTPSGGDPYFSSVSLLLHMDSIGESFQVFIDSSSYAHTQTAFDAAQQTQTGPKFGAACGLFATAGDPDYVLSDGSSTMAFGAGDFTIELWFKLVDLATDQTLIDFRPDVTNGAYPALTVVSAGNYSYYVNTGERIAGGAVTAGDWHHVAVCRSGTSTKIFHDGTQVGSTWTDNTVYLNGANRPCIGTLGFLPAVNTVNGRIDELRITKGVARYTSNFTPPTAAFPSF